MFCSSFTFSCTCSSVYFVSAIRFTLILLPPYRSVFIANTVMSLLVLRPLVCLFFLLFRFHDTFHIDFASILQKCVYSKHTYVSTCLYLLVYLFFKVYHTFRMPSCSFNKICTSWRTKFIGCQLPPHFHSYIQGAWLQVLGNLRGDSWSRNKTKIENNKITFSALFFSY